jgi:hypothetical protein
MIRPSRDPWFRVLTRWQVEKGTDVVFHTGSSAAARRIGGVHRRGETEIDGAAAGDWVTD